VDTNTLTLYLVAGGFSISLSLVLMVFAYLQPGTRMLNSFALAVLLLSVGFTVSGLGPALPRWMTVIGTNMPLIAAGVVLYSGFAAFYTQRRIWLDRFGWAVVALTALPFWYWGLIEPDGYYRSAVFSFAAAAIHGRTTLLLVRTARQSERNIPVWTLAGLLGILTLWMAARGVVSLLAETPPAHMRGANPTTWITVFWYIVLVSLATANVIWMEVSRLTGPQKEAAEQSRASFSWVDYFRHKLSLLWVIVLILLLGIVSEASVIFAKSFEWEKARLTRAAEQTNDTFVHHTQQVIAQVDTLLQAVRGFYLRTASVAETERFINNLPFDKFTINNVYLINQHGDIVISHTPAAARLSVADRDYFLFHQSTPADLIFISSVEGGRVTGKLHFRVTRRINLADGGFGGLILATVNPESFARYYQNQATGEQNTASLLGTLDHKLRARSPTPPSDLWQAIVESPLWAALALSPAGVYSNTSPVDHIRRVFSYKKIDALPLVMVTGFSEADLRSSVIERLRWLLLGTLTVIVSVLILAVLLTIEIKRRDEQDRFLSMLSHELKTPLSVLRMSIGMDGALSSSTRMHAQQSVQDMDAIIERCLQVDRLQQHRYVAVEQNCNLSELLAELQIASTMPQRIAIEAPAVANHMPDFIPNFMTDTQLLRIALGNLIDNALKYSPPDSQVRISASRQPHKKQPGILIEISNLPGSAGFPNPGKVFKKYYRSPHAHNKTGSGLGLYLVRSIAHRLGGWVRYVPEPVQVRFHFWLPV